MGHRKSHLVTNSHFQREIKFNIWCGIIDGYLLGLYKLPSSLNGDFYLKFLQIQLADLLYVAIEFKKRYVFYARWCSNTLLVTSNKLFKYPFSWPLVRSWKRNVLACTVSILIRWIKPLIYEDTINTQEKLRQRIVNAPQSFRIENFFLHQAVI